MVAVLIVAGLLVTVLGYRQYYRITTTPAWVAATELNAGDVITAETLKQARIEDAAGAISNPRHLIGAVLRVSKKQGDTFVPADLASKPKSYLAEAVPEGRVLYTITPRDPAIPYTRLRMGDRLDVLARGRNRVRLVARDVLLLGALRSPSARRMNDGSGRTMLTRLAEPPSRGKKSQDGTPLVLAVRPEDVYPLAGIGDSERVSVVLHGETELQKGKLLDIKPDPTHRKVEMVDGLERKTIYVQL